MRSALVALFALLSASSAAGQEKTARASNSREVRLHLDLAYEHLSNGFGPWRSAALALHLTRSNDSGIWVGVKETTRFARRDHDVSAGVEHRLTSRLTAAVEADASPSHHVSPAWGVAGRLQLDAAGGWGAQVGVEHRRYSSAEVDLGAITVERYLDRYRAAYTLHVARLHGGGTSAVHRASGDLYYGRSSNSIGVNVSAGEELENIQPIGVLRTPVRAASIVGRQWLTPRWFVTYDVLVHEQGSLYVRRRLGLGIGHRF